MSKAGEALAEVILDNIPVSGEIEVSDLRSQVMAVNPHAMTVFHQMRRSGAFQVRVDGGHLYVSRSGGKVKNA